MRRKIAWLFVWTTLTLWLGCGENQNFRINEESTPIFKAEEPPHSDASTSIQGDDRSNWPGNSISPERAAYTHTPHYFDLECCSGRRWSFTADRPSPLVANDPDCSRSLTRAASDDQFKFNLSKVANAFLAPAKTSYDLVTLPVRATVVERPWELYTSHGNGE